MLAFDPGNRPDSRAAEAGLRANPVPDLEVGPAHLSDGCPPAIEGLHALRPPPGERAKR